jgi:hypothetical protein
MKCTALSKIWKGLSKNQMQINPPALQTGQVPLVAPLTVGLRIDTSVPTGAGKETTVTKFIWVSPAGSSRQVRSLRVLLMPN